MSIYSIYLFYVTFAFVYEYYKFYLLLLLLLLNHLFLIHFVVVALVFLFILFYCRLSVLCCLCWKCLLAPCYSFASTTLHIFLFLFSFLTHCVSNLSYCYYYLYDSALVLVVWLLTLLVYNLPYGDFSVT